MRTRFFALLVVLVLGAMSQASAQSTCPHPSGAFAFETITVSTASLGFTTATFAPTGQRQGSVAVITIESNPVRWRADGTDPTSSVGHLASVGTVINVCGTANLRNFRMIRQGSADATATVSYFR